MLSIILSSVVFPHPLGPKNDTNSLSPIVKFMSSRARNRSPFGFEKVFLRLRIPISSLIGVPEVDGGSQAPLDYDV